MKEEVDGRINEVEARLARLLSELERDEQSRARLDASGFPVASIGILLEGFSAGIARSAAVASVLLVVCWAITLRAGLVAWQHRPEQS